MVKVILLDVNGVIQSKGTLKGLINSEKYNWPFKGNFKEKWNEVSRGFLSLDEFLSGVNKEVFLKDFVEKTELAENLVSTIEELRKEFVVCVCSNHIPEVIEYYFKENKINDIFDKVFVSSNGLAKPDKKFYEMIVDELKVSFEDCVLFDDQIKNLIPTKEYGIKTIWIESEKSIEKKDRENFPDFKPDFVLEKFEDLLKIKEDLK